jgi:hypothetical protein
MNVTVQIYIIVRTETCVWKVLVTFA